MRFFGREKFCAPGPQSLYLPRKVCYISPVSTLRAVCIPKCSLNNSARSSVCLLAISHLVPTFIWPLFLPVLRRRVSRRAEHAKSVNIHMCSTFYSPRSQMPDENYHPFVAATTPYTILFRCFFYSPFYNNCKRSKFNLIGYPHSSYCLSIVFIS